MNFHTIQDMRKLKIEKEDGSFFETWEDFLALWKIRLDEVREIYKKHN